MKSLKKILSIFAAFMMVVGLTAANVKAAGNGTITITDGKEGATYTAYKLFDASSTADGNNSSYVLTATDYNSYWKDKTFTGTNPFIFTLTPSGDYSVSTTATPSTVAKFLRDNLATLGYAVAGTATVENGETSTTIEGLNPGYYYVNSTTGSMVMITTATPNATIVDKNTTDFDKNADGDDDSDDVVDKNVGDIINFTISFKLNKGMTNVFVTDTMTNGLTFDKASVVVKSGNDTLVSKANNATEYDYEVITTDIQETFKVVFSQSYLDKIVSDTTVTLEYTATVNENAAYKQNDTNKATLNENNNPNMGTDIVTVRTSEFAIKKIDGATKGNVNPTALAGATFKVYSDATHTNVLKFTEKDGKYVLDAANGKEEVTTKSDGILRFGGLVKGTYYLVETKAPEGFNLMDNHIKIESQYHSEDEEITPSNIENNKGTVLPSTGGMGTTMIYIAGAILMVGAAIIFVTNKRMKHE